MSHATNAGVRIRYETIGNGPPLVALHGFGESGESWKLKGLADALGPGRRLVLIDARGHGDSDKPHSPAAYAVETLVADVVAVMDDAAIERADFLGYSQGGWVALGMAAYAPDRVGHLVIGGATPFGQDLSLYRQLTKSDLATALTMLETAAGFEFAPDIERAFLRNDLEALRAAYAQDRPDISPALAAFDRSCLLICGDDDPLRDDMQRMTELLRASRLHVVPGNHVQVALQLAALGDEINRFLDDGSNGSR